MRLLVLCMTAAFFLSQGAAAALNIGVAPPTIDAGDMLPGESKSVEFYIMSDHDNDLLVEFSSKRAPREFFDPEKGRFRYAFVAEEGSEEDVSSWLTLMDDSIIVPPEKELKYLKGGGLAYANEKVEVIISVPEDAEPGYHAGFVTPYPKTGAQGGGTGLGIITVVELGVVFNVLGDAVRDAEIAGISFVRDAPGYGTLSVLVKNKGTVTLSALADNIRVYDSSNKTIAESSSKAVHIEPGRIGSLEMRLDAPGLDGQYGVSAHVEWVTGEGSVDGTIDVGEYVPAAPGVTGSAVAPAGTPAAGFPFWIIPLVLAAIGGLVYWRIR